MTQRKRTSGFGPRSNHTPDLSNKALAQLMRETACFTRPIVDPQHKDQFDA